MNKEEILNKIDWIVDYVPYNDTAVQIDSMMYKDILKAMQEYADQETERLKAELEAKSEMAEMYRRNLNRSQEDCLLEIDRHKNHIKVLQSELNELKEKHKKDVINAVDDMSNILIANDVIVSQINFNGTIGEKYYKQKFESND